MASLSKLFDLGVGTCFCHPTPIPMVGFIITGSPNNNLCYKPQARIFDIVLGYCGHIGILINGNSTIMSDYRQAVHVGSIFVGCFNGVISTGCNSTLD